MTAATSSIPSHVSRILHLTNGCKISYSVVGPNDGYPVIFFQGLSGHRLTTLLFDQLLEKYHLRLISPDRPGNGLSDEQTKEEKHPLCSIIAQLLEDLGIDHFAILAQSFGTVFALATTLKLPEKIVGPIQLVSPWIPLSEPATNPSLRNLRHVPNFLLSASLRTMACMPKLALSFGSVNAMTTGWSANEKKIYTPGFSSTYQEILAVSTKERSSYAADVIACLEKEQPFGFSYYEVDYPINIYHGDKDGMIPLEAVNRMKSKMSNATLYVQPEGTHNLLFDVEILEMIFSNLHDIFKTKALS
ncbi:alpha/beta-hydrolase [Basidiobolus meristosporus CBS 931.73]|uniref:Alpha/beta-hydrolase n=1 Tax=Basidiobolus meristosporus CBS 931.73 TaxID=1314790 RepID=A0A1Y1YST3_9FUNG|nr:alpha/beta-hydrolase [Basidiobolus meristosporus CBS 931.73]|eukprot:ORY00807.1 alpha/beta-hydrolase [Basidiobolus meristosporus CBS 931.73]